MAIVNSFLYVYQRVVEDMAKAHLPFTEDTEAELARDIPWHTPFLHMQNLNLGLRNDSHLDQIGFYVILSSQTDSYWSSISPSLIHDSTNKNHEKATLNPTIQAGSNNIQKPCVPTKTNRQVDPTVRVPVPITAALNAQLLRICWDAKLGSCVAGESPNLLLFEKGKWW